MTTFEPCNWTLQNFLMQYCVCFSSKRFLCNCYGLGYMYQKCGASAVAARALVALAWPVWFSSALVDRSGSHAVEQTKVVMCYMEGGQGWDRLSWQPPLPKNCPSQVFFTTGPERKRTIGNAKVKLIREGPGSHSCHHHLLWNVWNKAVKSKYLGTRIVHSNFRDGKPFKARMR